MNAKQKGLRPTATTLSSPKNNHLIACAVMSMKRPENLNNKREISKNAAKQVAYWIKLLSSTPDTDNPLFTAIDIKKSKKLLLKAENNISKYNKVGFPKGKSKELLNQEKIAIKKLNQLREKHLSDCQSQFVSLKARLLNCLETFSKDLRWENDPKLPPSYLHPDSMAILSRDLKKYRSLLSKEQNTELENIFLVLKKQNRARAKMAAQRLKPKPHLYQQPNESLLIACANNTIMAAFPKASIKTTRLTEPQWRELEQWENENGHSRFVVKREILAQVAALINRRMKLFTLSLYQEQKPGKTWTDIQGHIHFSDPMRTSNIL